MSSACPLLRWSNPYSRTGTGERSIARGWDLVDASFFQRRGGRKRIVAPDGSELAPSSKPQPDGTLVKALARAWRWQRMLDDGVYASVSEIGDAENISKSYVSRILRLALLAPDIVASILAGQTDQALMLGKLERPLPASWEEQRGLLSAVSTPITGTM